MRKGVLIVGATSTVARAICCSFAKQHYPLYLACQDQKELSRLISDLKIRYPVEVHGAPFDPLQISQHKSFVQKVSMALGGIEGAIWALEGKQEREILAFWEEEKILRSNLVGACSFFHHVANELEKEKSGFLIGLSQVASDYPNQTNYPLAAAMGGVSLYLEGLRDRLSRSAVHVMSAKLCSDCQKKEDAEEVAEQIIQALYQEKATLYAPRLKKRVRRYIMTFLLSEKN